MRLYKILEDKTLKVFFNIELWYKAKQQHIYYAKIIYSDIETKDIIFSCNDNIVLTLNPIIDFIDWTVN